MSSSCGSVFLSHRGELNLCQYEVDRINGLISHLNFRMEPYSSAELSVKSSEGTARSQSLEDGNRIKPASKHRTSNVDRYKDLTLKSEQDSPVSGKRSLRARKHPLTSFGQYYEDHSDNNSLFSGRVTYKTEKLPKVSKGAHKSSQSARQSDAKASRVSLYKTVPNTSRNFPKLPKNSWEYTCYRILQTIKYVDTDKWFWYPVDPVADGVPNYWTIIKHPMDFQTIVERLHTNYYSNPYGWQCDVRQIFFNAFLFYPPDNRIWQAAEHLAKMFEAKLNCYRFINPHEFQGLLEMNPEEAKAELQAYNEITFARRGVLQSSKSRYGQPDGVDDEVDDAEQNGEMVGTGRMRSSYAMKGRRGGERDYMYDVDEYLSEYESSPHDSSEEHSGDYFKVPYVSSRGRPRGRKSKSVDHALEVFGKRGRKSKSMILGRMATKKDKYGSMMDVPDVGYVPPPPPLLKLTVNDRSLTLAQQKTLEINMSKLATNQRKAALELIQDDLGILAETYKNDRNFVFDTGLLSIEKQRRFFLYVNQMVRRNMEGAKRPKAHQRTVKQVKKMPGDKNKESSVSNPSEMFDASSSTSSSSLSDVASNFLSSDEFFSSSDSDNSDVTVTTKDAKKPSAMINGKNMKNDTPLPEYKPVDEFESEKAQISRGIMGNHADFLGRMESLKDTPDGPTVQGKRTAWMEWKGQVIHHGMVTQHNGVPPRSVDEQIAEGFDARI